MLLSRFDKYGLTTNFITNASHFCTEGKEETAGGVGVLDLTPAMLTTCLLVWPRYFHVVINLNSSVSPKEIT